MFDIIDIKAVARETCITDAGIEDGSLKEACLERVCLEEDCFEEDVVRHASRGHVSRRPGVLQEKYMQQQIRKIACMFCSESPSSPT
jgi:hypothetical protein